MGRQSSHWQMITIADVTLKIGSDAVAAEEKMVDRKFGNSNHVLPIGQTTHIKYEAKDEAGKDLYQV